MKLFNKKDSLLELIREGQPMTLRQQLHLTAALSIPAFLAQLSFIVMQYIDASMVGRIGAEAAASIGLVSTTTWLFSGLSSSVSTGFAVQVAHLIGANEIKSSRSVLRQALTSALVFGILLSLIGIGISHFLPHWLGGNEEICADASRYFLIFSCVLPAYQLASLSGAMLRCSGNMVTPSVLGIALCIFDIIFNFLFIFPTRTIHIINIDLTIPGAGLGVVGAALGTGVAIVLVCAMMLYFLCFRSDLLKINRERGSFCPHKAVLKKAAHIGLPLGVQHFLMCSAQIMTTIIVAPLGTFAIAAYSFAITAESLCYMPGYGIADAATTLVGQAHGARRPELMHRFANITVVLGILVMSIMGIIMYFGAPAMMAMLTPSVEVQQMGISALQIEAFAEPMFAASIVIYSIFIGVGDTMIPAGMNLFSIWAVRLTMAAWLAPRYGLDGVFFAMCLELCFRGIIFLVRLRWGKWDKVSNPPSNP